MKAERSAVNRGYVAVQWWGTHDTTEDVAFVGVFVLHAEVGEDGGLILGNSGVVELLDLG